MTDQDEMLKALDSIRRTSRFTAICAGILLAAAIIAAIVVGYQSIPGEGLNLEAPVVKDAR